MTAVMAAVGEPDLWPDALDLVAKFFGGVAAMAEFHTDEGQHIALGPRNRFLTDANLRLYIDHYAALCPRPVAMRNGHLPAVQTDRFVGDHKELDANPFYSELLRRDGLGDYLGLRLRLRNGAVDVLNVHRLKKDGHASDEEIAWMHELAPFLRAAFRARALLGEAAVGAEGVLASVARLEAPVAFLGAGGELLFQNAAASALLGSEPVTDWPALLRRWQEATVGVEDSAAVPLGSPGGNWRMRIIDLRGAMDERRTGGGVYVVMLAPSSASGAGPVARHGLTATESGVLRELVEGRTPAEIARLQRVSLATVRTHIARLHEKFGVSRTLDVVRMAMNEGWERI
ncbi:MAG: helix-turn-helix transcriptional regulator [Devosia sp.]